MVAQYDKDQSYTEQLSERRRRDIDLARQQEIQREFLLNQVDELAADFVDHPEQIGNYISDLEAAGMLGVADKGMLFRRLWETMGPSFADRAFHMTERAVESGAAIAQDIANDANTQGAFQPQGVSSAEAQNLDHASQILQGFASALGLNLDLKGRPDVDTTLDAPAHIHDPDGERAKKTQELLDVLAPQLGVAADVDVHVDEEARHHTADQGLLGLMSEGSVFLNPDVYDPETAEGRGLLAHEVSHIAQRENQLSGASYADPSIADAERESHEIMEMFAAGNNVEAPLASLDAYDKAACGPRSMQEKEPEPNEPTTEVEVVPPEYEIVEDTIEVPPIHFDFDKWNIREDAAVILGKVATTIAAYPEITAMELEGHTDARGSNSYNMELSDKRVHSAVDHLYNVNGVKIPLAWIGMGEEDLKIPGAKTEAEHQENRRVVFRITTVNGQPLNGAPFKPTKQVMTQPGKTIIRYLDADGNVIKTEVVEDGQAPEGPPAAENETTTDGGSGSSGAGSTGGNSGGGANSGQPIGDSTTSNAPVSQSTTSATPAGKNKQSKGGAKAPWRRAGNAIRTVAQPKAGPGGLKATSMRQATQSGGGEKLPDAIRSKFETAFGVDFSDVRIHRGSAQATGIGATAFARGSDIHFAPGRYDATSQSSQAVLGHELTHVVQQRAGRVSIGQGKGTHINAERALEAEADLLGARAARGERVQVQGSALGLAGRAARGDAPDAIQFEGGAAAATEEDSAEAPTQCELKIAGQTISARMPSGASPGEVRVDFSSAASPITGLTFGSASVTFDDDWKVERGTINASVAIGDYVRADDVSLTIEKRGEDGVIEAQITGAQLNISELFDTTIDLTVGSEGISGTATIEASAPITLGQGITLTSGSLVVTLGGDGTLGATGTLVGDIEGLGQVTVTAEALSDGSLSGRVEFAVVEGGLPMPGIEGVTLVSGSIGGSYTHQQSWTVTGSLSVNIRDWVGAEITATYVHGEEGGAGDASSWTLTGVLTQLQPYSLEAGTETLTLENASLTVGFTSGVFDRCELEVDYTTNDWAGHVSVDYDPIAEMLGGTGTIELTQEELPIGDGGIKLTAASATLTVEENILTTMTGSATVIFPYKGEDTFELTATELSLKIPEKLASGTGNVTTLRKLDFGDTAAYNMTVEEGASAELTISDNQLMGISGGLAFGMKYAADEIGTGNVDVTFDGPTNILNATATFTLSAEDGFGVPDRVTGPVMLLPGGTFIVSIENSELASAEVRSLTYEVKQEGEGATGKLGGTLNGSYDFRTSMLNVSGDATIQTEWPLAEANGVALTFKEGGTIDVTIADNILTRIHGEFPFEATVAERDDIPELLLDGSVSGDYSQETGFFSGELNATLRQTVQIPMGEAGADRLDFKEGATITATVTESTPATLSCSFDADYYRDGTHFLEGHVENASYEFTTGDFDFVGELTLKTKVEKETDDGKWKFVVLPGTSVGVEVEDSALKMLTGSIEFEIHDAKGALIKGNLTEAQIDVEKLEFTGTLVCALARDVTYPQAEGGGEAAAEGSPAVSIVAKKDVSSVGGTVTANVFEELTANLHFGVKLGTEEYGAGQVGGTLNMQTNNFTGNGDITLVKDLILGGNEVDDAGNPVASWILAFAQGQGLNIALENNVLTEATINLGAKLFHNYIEVANGSVNGQYKLGDTEGFNGSVTANIIKDLDWADGDQYHYWLEQGTNFTGTMENNAITSASGEFKLRLDEGTEQAIRVTINGAYAAGSGFSAGGEILVLNDLKIAERGAYTLYLAKDSGGSATVEGIEVTSLTGDITLLVKKDDIDFAKGAFTVDYALGEENASVTAEGSVELLEPVEVAAEGDWKFFVEASTGVEFKLVDSVPQYVKGQINASASYKEASCVTGNLNVDCNLVGEPMISADGSIEVTSQIDLGIHVGDYNLKIDPGTGATFDVKDNILQTVGGTINLGIEDEVGPLLSVELNGTYTHAGQDFTGTGSVVLVRSITVAEGVGSKGYGFYVEPGTGANAVVTASALESLGGTLIVSVSEGSEDSKFLLATGSLTYTAADGGSVSGNALVEVTREVKMLTTTAGYVAWLSMPTSAEIAVTDMNIDGIIGQVAVRIDKPEGEAFARITLQGDYSEATGFNGSGTAELCQEVEIISMPIGSETYTLWALPSTSATMVVENSDIKSVGGSLEAMIRDDGDFIQISATGVTYDFPGQKFTGSGSATVLHDEKLATFAGQELWLAQGTGINASVTLNKLDEISGAVKLKLKDEEGFYLNCDLQGGFDASGGTGFSGVGSATVTRRKKLAELGAYSFWLKEGAGATAHIDANKLTKVTGQVPFEVHDELGVLIEGNAEGEYNTETKKFTGSGSVYLGRNVEYEIGGIKLVFKEGSGGRGEVKDNELRKLGGTLKVDVWDDQGAMVGFEADGEFDAVKKKILHVEGTAKLLRPIEIGGTGAQAIIKINKLEGSGRVENNELQWIRGKLDFEMPRVLNMKGWVEGGWEATGGNDVFYGSGKIDFTLFDDPSKGRSMKGEVDFTYNRDETWNVHGKVDYELNEMLGGSIDVECDQEFDPILGGEIHANEVTLVEGRDIFKWSKDFDLLKTTVWAGPVPIDINGGVVVGLGLNMQPLTFSASAAFSNWRPISAATEVPDFSARADLNTGLRFEAALKPYFGVGLGVSGVASAGMRLMGEICLGMDVNVNPYAEIQGVDGEYGGSLGVNLGISANGELAMTPQLYATLGKTWTHDLTRLTHNLGELFSLDYNFAFPFGDVPAAPVEGSGGGSKQSVAPTTTAIQGHEDRPSLPSAIQGSPNQPGPVKGGPDMNQANKNDEAKSDADDPMAGVMEKIDQIQVWGEKIGAVAKVGGDLVSMLTFMVTVPQPFGAAVAGGYLAYKLISGSLTLAEIQLACTTVWEIITEIAPAGIAALLPKWLTDLWTQIKDSSPEQLFADMLTTMATWLKREFPSASGIIDELVGMATNIAETIGGIIRNILSDNFGLDDFLDICKELGGAIAGMVLGMLADIAAEAAADAGRAVVSFVTDPPW